MLFNSIPFALFYIVVTLLYYALPFKFRWLLLLAASCFFYMAFVPIYILILGFTIIIDFFAGIYIQGATGQKRKIFLIISLLSNIGILVFFKFFDFISENINLLLRGFHYTTTLQSLNILLPIGLSFHTFQAMSYTIEVYRGNQRAERHLGIYSLYVMFYPQLVAGPIERPQNLISQFRKKHVFSYDNVTKGLKLMAWGLFKKIVIADRLAGVVNAIYGNAEKHNGLSLFIATIFFSFQIFCDFSGYSDIAIGAAKTMGFTLMKNFEMPYLSLSISEFWRKWHISLSTWFKDYLYIPLGGNRVSIPRLYFNVLVVFLISGLWHGANWTFVIWGALHGFYVIFGLATKKYRHRASEIFHLKRVPFLNIISTFSLVAFAWIFFRAANLRVAIAIIKTIILDLPDIVYRTLHHTLSFNYIGISKNDFTNSTWLILLLVLLEILQKKYNIIQAFNESPLLVRWIGYYSLIFLTLALGLFNNTQFIYFQF